MQVARRIADVALVILAVVAVFMSCLLLYFSTIGKDLLPHSVNSTYATTVYDPVTGQNLPLIEANYYANKNKNGYEVMEFRFNVYSGVLKQGIYSRGFQMVWNKSGNIMECVDPTANNKKSDVWYYDSYYGGSYITGHEYSFDDPMYIDISGKTYAIKLDGTYEKRTGFNAGKSFVNFWKAIIKDTSMFEDDSNWFNYEEFNYTYKDLLLKIRQIIQSSSNGTGDGVISLVDLGNFLHVYDVDSNDNPEENPIGDKGLINSYFTMATHYDNRGMTWTKQSMFGSVAGDSEFNISGIRTDVEYWQAKSTYTLTEQDFEPRFSSVDYGFYYVLPTSTIDQLKKCTNIEIDIVFNISRFDKNVLGFDYYALNGIQVHSLTITSVREVDFKLLVGSLKDTGLTRSTISTTNVNLININSGVEL